MGWHAHTSASAAPVAAVTADDREQFAVVELSDGAVRPWYLRDEDRRRGFVYGVGAVAFAIFGLVVSVLLSSVNGGINTLTRYTEMVFAEKIGLFCAMGVLTGTIGINYAHELMHKSGKIERWLADSLLAMVLYSHFRSEHLLVHHIHVGTPKDPVTAKYNENFYKFFIRVLVQCPISSFKSESNKLGRKGLSPSDFSNPFYIYLILQIFMIVLSLLIGGFLGLFLFFLQAFVAILLLELVNYIEHYGLSRKILKNGKYEFVQPHHSWNSTYKVSNWVLINLQRHSDHHFKPARSFPLLQNLGATKAPQLPHSYPAMGILALFPSAWMSIMNPRVTRWREMFYPEITEW